MASIAFRGMSATASQTFDPETDYYLTTSSFEYFPGLPIYHSQDLKTWTLIGHALTRRSQFDQHNLASGAGICAPTLRWRPHPNSSRGRFYLSACWRSRQRHEAGEKSSARSFYIWTDDIRFESCWSDPIYFDECGSGFWDDDGGSYLSTSATKGSSIIVAEVDLTSGTTLTKRKTVESSPQGIGAGSHIVKRGSFHYLFVSELLVDGGYHQCVYRSSQGLFGPWTAAPNNPLEFEVAEESHDRKGYTDIFEDASGKWWAVLYAMQPLHGKPRIHALDGRRLVGSRKLPLYGHPEAALGSEVFLAKIDWENDWPTMGTVQNITLITDEPAIELAKDPPLSWQADFSSESLEVGWYTRYAPCELFYTLRDKHLHLLANTPTRDSAGLPAMLLRKHTAFRQILTAHIRFNTKNRAHEAGVILFWGADSYATLGLRRSDDKKRIICEFKQNVNPTRPGRQTCQIRKDKKDDLFEFEIRTYRQDCDLNFYDVDLHDKTDGSFQVRWEDMVRNPAGEEEYAGSAGMMWGVYAYGDGDESSGGDVAVVESVISGTWEDSDSEFDYEDDHDEDVEDDADREKKQLDVCEKPIIHR